MSVYFEKSVARGFGTFPLKGEELIAAVQTAYDIGYRAFDTAQIYQNEADLGHALWALNSEPDELFITSKVHPDNFDEKFFMPSVEKSLSDLGVNKLQMLLLHWPPANGEIEAPLKLLAQAKKAGLAAHIGVSNFNAKMMVAAQNMIDVPIDCNQVEFHPLLDQSILQETSAKTGIGLVSYCSVARGEIFKYPLFAEIGARYRKSAAQVALRWILQKGVALNTMSTKAENMRANFDIVDFALSAEEMASIDALNTAGYRIVSSNLVPWAPEWD